MSIAIFPIATAAICPATTVSEIGGRTPLVAYINLLQWAAAVFPLPLRKLSRLFRKRLSTYLCYLKLKLKFIILKDWIPDRFTKTIRTALFVRLSNGQYTRVVFKVRIVFEQVNKKNTWIKITFIFGFFSYF